MDLTAFAEEVGSSGAVTISGLGTRGGPLPSVRCVGAPAGIDWLQVDEMVVCCGAGTPVAELAAVLADAGQRVALPAGGTVGGALSAGVDGVRRLGDGPLRDVLLQARYVGADGQLVKAGGPTVKNVSGFDLCRLLVGARGTLGFLGDVILRTRPRPDASSWWSIATDRPLDVFAQLYRPVSVLWDGGAMSVLLEGHPADVEAQAAAAGLAPIVGPPLVPWLGAGQRSAIPPDQVEHLTESGGGPFVVEIGVGVVHRPPAEAPAVAPMRSPVVAELLRRVKGELDPTGRLNPGLAI